jgi:transposase
MIKAYSIDLRERAVALLDEGATSLEVAELLDVSDSWVRKMRLRRAALGHLMPGSPPGKERKLSPEQEDALLFMVLDQPDVTLEELVALVWKRLKVQISVPTISRRLIAMGMTRKKRASMPPKPTGRRSGENAKASSVDTSSETRRG